MQFKDISYEATGLTPLLVKNPERMNEPPPKGQAHWIGREQAMKDAYITKEGLFYLPALHARNSLLYAAKGLKLQDMKTSKKASAVMLISAGVFVIQDGERDKMIILESATKKPFRDFEVDTRSVVIQKQRVPCSRAMFTNWVIRFSLSFDLHTINPSVCDELFERAGQVCGWGDFRVACKGWFGRFEIKRITKV